MSNGSAKDKWQEKLEFLLAKEVLVVDSGEKFKLQQDIAEARRKLQEIGADPAAPFTPARSAPGPLPREISYDLLLAYSDVDCEYAEELADYLLSRGLRLVLAPRALFAETPEDFESLERSIRFCHAAAILVSDTSLRQLEERRKHVTTAFEMIEARTENLFAVCLSNESAAEMAAWPLGCTQCVSGWTLREAPPPRALHEKFEALRLNTGLDSRMQWVGLPVVVGAMTQQEAKDLDANPALVKDGLGREAYEHFMELRAAVSSDGLTVTEKYGLRRNDWAPFSGPRLSIWKLLNTLITQINDDPPFQLRGRSMKLQNYSFDELIHHETLLSAIFTELQLTGCVVIVDEYSLFHPDIRRALLSSGLLGSNHVSLVTLSPSNPYSTSPFTLLEGELSSLSRAVSNRFASVFDPQCELSVGDEKRLKRWLNSSLPYTIQSLRNPRPNPQNIVQLSNELDMDPKPKIGSLLYSPSGPL
jgi:hypothetical protein